jgi:CheY-like chemotaxis protein
MRVLVADGDRDTVMTIGILLRSEGHEVWLEQDGRQVAEAVRQFKPRLILLDLAMPDRSGYEVAQELSLEYGMACPVLVAASAHTTPADKERAEISGFHRFIAKPYDPEALLSLVAQLAV